MLQAVRETKTIEKVVYTSSFFALGPTDGYVADETQVQKLPHLHFLLRFFLAHKEKKMLLIHLHCVPQTPNCDDRYMKRSFSAPNTRGRRLLLIRLR